MQLQLFEIIRRAFISFRNCDLNRHEGSGTIKIHELTTISHDCVPSLTRTVPGAMIGATTRRLRVMTRALVEY
jgi:hypothetical protein